MQVEAWGRLTDSQLRCSMAVNPELSSSLALIIQGHHLPHRYYEYTDGHHWITYEIHNIPVKLILNTKPYVLTIKVHAQVMQVLLCSKDLMVKVVQNIPSMLVYLPSQLNIRSQVGSYLEYKNSNLLCKTCVSINLYAVHAFYATCVGICPLSL